MSGLYFPDFYPSTTPLPVEICDEDEPIHTDDHPYCDDPTCPCHLEETEEEEVL
jgi:hypothetical protein